MVPTKISAKPNTKPSKRHVWYLLPLKNVKLVFFHPRISWGEMERIWVTESALFNFENDVFVPPPVGEPKIFSYLPTCFHV